MQTNIIMETMGPIVCGAADGGGYRVRHQDNSPGGSTANNDGSVRQ